MIDLIAESCTLQEKRMGSALGSSMPWPLAERVLCFLRNDFTSLFANRLFDDPISVCSHSQHCPEMTLLFVAAVRRIPHCRELSTTLSYLHVFDSRKYEEMLVSVLAQPITDITRRNFRKCLESLLCLHTASRELQCRREMSFSYENRDHIHLLDRLWFAAFPQRINVFEDYTDRNWGDLGFQKANDPASDFRGLGLLGLQQLVYFFENRFSSASSILTLANRESAYFPFAATSLSMGTLVLTLLKEGRLHQKLLTALDTFQLLVKGDETRIHTFVVEELHNVYCEIFERFAILWSASNARNVMDFPRVFGSLQAELRQAYPSTTFANRSTLAHQTQSIVL